MQTSKQVEEEFMSKLKALLKEYGADIKIEERYNYSLDYTPFIQVEIPSIWTETEQVREYTSIDCGTYID